MRPLNDLMEFDHVIRVTEDGQVVDAPAGIYTPECYVFADEDGQVAEDPDVPGWELLSGYSGQDRYHGPVMHPSEFIGGRMERDILARPGLYVALVVDVLGVDEDADEEPAGWAVAYRPA